MRIAVLGLYNSGSSAVAGVLHHLGVNMGAPYWGDFYEPVDLKGWLCRWWDEPRLREMTPREERIMALRRWIERREDSGFHQVGAKHPLLCLSATDLLEAWGNGVKYVWAHRNLEDSIRGLEKRQWFPDPKFMQKKLWAAVTAFLADREHLRLEFENLLGDPVSEIERITQYLELSPGRTELNAAVREIRPRG